MTVDVEARGQVPTLLSPKSDPGEPFCLHSVVRDDKKGNRRVTFSLLFS